MSTIKLHSPLNISETVGDSQIEDHRLEMAYGKSNSHVTDDIT